MFVRDYYQLAVEVLYRKEELALMKTGPSSSSLLVSVLGCRSYLGVDHVLDVVLTALDPPSSLVHVDGST
jgi:hypothetical protein